VMCGSTRIT